MVYVWIPPSHSPCWTGGTAPASAPDSRMFSGCSAVLPATEGYATRMQKEDGGGGDAIQQHIYRFCRYHTHPSARRPPPAHTAFHSTSLPPFLEMMPPPPHANPSSCLPWICTTSSTPPPPELRSRLPVHNTHTFSAHARLSPPSHKPSP